MAADETETTVSGVLVAQRAALLELLEELPETRLSKLTPRHGWTLRHELAWLAAADAELLRRLELTAAPQSAEPEWRRIRGQAMHTAQEMRLAALREHLQASGTRVAASLATHSDRLADRPLHEALESHAAHGESALDSVRAVLGR